MMKTLYSLVIFTQHLMWWPFRSPLVSEERVLWGLLKHLKQADGLSQVLRQRRGRMQRADAEWKL